MNTKKYKPRKIAVLIKQNKWPTVQEVTIDDFVYEPVPNEYAPNMSTIIQSRSTEFDEDFIKRATRREKNGNGHSERATIVYFSEETEIDGQVIEANSVRGIGGTHGLVIDKYAGKDTKEANVVDFKNHLGSSYANLLRLANLLNKVKKEVQPLIDEDIKRELYILMDDKKGKLSDEEREDFLEDYDQINIEQYILWVSHHKIYGGRRAPTVGWTKAELQVEHEKLKNMECYNDYWIPPPATSSAWETRIGLCFLKCSKLKTKKFLQPLYADNITQTEQLRSGKLKNKVQKKLDELKKFWNVEDPAVTWMKY